MLVNMFRTRCVSHRFLCWTLAAIMAAGPAAARAQQPAGDSAAKAPLAEAKADLSCVVPNACLVLIMRPAQVLNSPLAEMYPTEVIQAAMVQETGLDPMAAAEAVVSVGSPMAGPPSYSVLASFDEAMKLKAGKMTEHTESATLAGKEYLKSVAPNPMAPSFYQPTDKQLLLAPDFALPGLLEGKAPGAPSLAATAEASYRGDDLLAIVDVAALRPLVQMAMMQAEMPPELASLRELPNLVKQVELRANFSRPGVTELIVTANNRQDADRIVSLFNEGKQQVIDKILAENQRALASDDPVEQAGGRYAQRMTNIMSEQLQLQQEGDQLILFRAEGDGSDRSQLMNVATIGVLVALLLPAVQAAREAARRNASMNNMKQIMLGLLNHEAARRAFPAHASYSADGKPLLSWRVHLLPYMEQQELYNQFHLDEPWDSEHNKKLIPLMPELFLDPSSALTAAEGKTHYLGAQGADYFFDGSEAGRMLHDIADGSSNSIAVLQVDDEAAVPWTKPSDWQPEEGDLLKAFDGPHPGGFLAAFCDGHVNFISQGIDAEAFKALLTVAGGEAIDLNNR